MFHLAQRVLLVLAIYILTAGRGLADGPTISNGPSESSDGPPGNPGSGGPIVPGDSDSNWENTKHTAKNAARAIKNAWQWANGNSLGQKEKMRQARLGQEEYIVDKAQRQAGQSCETIAREKRAAEADRSVLESRWTKRRDEVIDRFRKDWNSLGRNPFPKDREMGVQGEHAIGFEYINGRFVPKKEYLFNVPKEGCPLHGWEEVEGSDTFRGGFDHIITLGGESITKRHYCREIPPDRLKEYDSYEMWHRLNDGLDELSDLRSQIDRQNARIKELHQKWDRCNGQRLQYQRHQQLLDDARVSPERERQYREAGLLSPGGRSTAPKVSQALP